MIKQMSPVDRRRLLDLVPELRQVAMQAPPRTVAEARAAVERVQTEVMQALSGRAPLARRAFPG